MSQLGAASPLAHVRGFFYPVIEKPEIQAAIDELEAVRGRPARRRRTSSPTNRRLAGSAALRAGRVSGRHLQRSELSYRRSRVPCSVVGKPGTPGTSPAAIDSSSG